MIDAGDEPARALSQAMDFHPVANQAPDLGLAHSLRVGLASLEERSPRETGAALVFLADQPLVQLSVVERLVAEWKAGAGMIVRPRYQANPGIPGHPVLLDRSIWPLVRRLQGDQGFAGLSESVSPPPVILDVAGDNPDVDTLADLQAIEEFRQ